MMPLSAKTLAHGGEDCRQPPAIATGVEWIVDAAGCRAQLLADLPAVRALCDRIVADLNLNVLGDPQWRQFPEPAGVTGLYLLSESHLACHTYPEFGLMTLNLYCCRPQADWPWKSELHQRMGAADVVVRRVSRGEFSGPNAQVAGRRP